MSKIEELVYNAYEHGKREVLFKEVAEIRQQYPRRPLEEIYDEAYQKIMKT